MNSIFLSHTDLDSMSVFLNKYFNIEFTDFMYTNYPDYENKQFLDYIKTFQEVYFADISPTKEQLDELLQSDIQKIYIYDHHEAHNYLQDLKNDRVEVYFDITKCGTKIYFENYVKPKVGRIPRIIEEFVEIVDVYDMWKLDNPLREKAENYNRLFLETSNYTDNSNKKNDKFIGMLLDRFSKDDSEFTDKEIYYINRKIDKEKAMLLQAKKFLKVKLDEKKVKYGITKASSCISYVASEILKENDIDYIIVLNTYGRSNNALSIRSKEHFDINQLNFVAGHKNAGGYNFPNRQLFNSFYELGKRLGYKETVSNI